MRILNLTDLESVTFLIGHEQPCDLKRLAEQEVRGSIPGLAEIGYLLLQSRDMADITAKAT